MASERDRDEEEKEDCEEEEEEKEEEELEGREKIAGMRRAPLLECNDPRDRPSDKGVTELYFGNTGLIFMNRARAAMTP